MNRLRSNIVLLLGVALLTMPAGAAPATQARPAERSAEFLKHEARINALVASNQIIEAISETAQYEVTLRSAQPPATLRDGHFRDTTRGLTFDIGKARDWKPLEITKEERSQVAMVGGEVLLLLRGPDGPDETLKMLSIDQTMMRRRLGLKGAAAPVDSRAQMRLMAERGGDISNERSEKRGDLEILRLYVNGERQTEFAAIDRDGVYYYLYITAAHDAKRAVLENAMNAWLASLKFDAPDEARDTRLKEITSRIPPEPDVKPLLTGTRELAEAGEIRAAMSLLVDLRVALSARLPKPQISADKGLSFASYGVKFKNPDPERWNPSVIPMGAMHLFGFEDLESVTPAGVTIGVMNPLLVYGPVFEEQLRAGNEDDEVRKLLRSIGRGGLANMSKAIEAEKFHRFKGLLAYQGQGPGRGANSQVKTLVIKGDGAIYMVILISAPKQMTELERFVDENLTLPPPAPSK